MYFFSKSSINLEILFALLFLLLKKILVNEKTIINAKIDAIKKVNELNVIKN